MQHCLPILLSVSIRLKLRGRFFSLWEGGPISKVIIIFIYCSIFLQFETYFLVVIARRFNCIEATISEKDPCFFFWQSSNYFHLLYDISEICNTDSYSLLQFFTNHDNGGQTLPRSYGWIMTILWMLLYIVTLRVFCLNNPFLPSSMKKFVCWFSFCAEGSSLITDDFDSILRCPAFLMFTISMYSQWKETLNNVN